MLLGKQRRSPPKLHFHWPSLLILLPLYYPQCPSRHYPDHCLRLNCSSAFYMLAARGNPAAVACTVAGCWPAGQLRHPDTPASAIPQGTWRPALSKPSDLINIPNVTTRVFPTTDIPDASCTVSPDEQVAALCLGKGRGENELSP